MVSYRGVLVKGVQLMPLIRQRIGGLFPPFTHLYGLVYVAYFMAQKGGREKPCV